MKRELIILGIPMLLMLACGSATSSETTEAVGKPRGEQLFAMNCTLCHGKEGGLGLNGAKDLRISTLTRAEMIALVTNGKGLMMPYRNTLTKAEIEAVVDHVRTLRKSE